MCKGSCKYAIPAKPPYQYPYICAVMYECIRRDGGSKDGGKSCIRFQIGENMERNGHKRMGRTVMQRRDDIRKALEDPSAEEVVIQKHCAMGKTEQMLELLGVLRKGEVKLHKHLK